MPRSRLRIPRPIFDAMLAHARADFPDECCGFLAGIDGVVTHRFPLVNALASPTAYQVDSRELLKAHRAMRNLGIGEVAIYHSHPSSAPVPSASDLSQNGYGDTIPHVIIGPGDEVQVWWIGESTFEEAEWEIGRETKSSAGAECSSE